MSQFQLVSMLLLLLVEFAFWYLNKSLVVLLAIESFTFRHLPLFILSDSIPNLTSIGPCVSQSTSSEFVKCVVSSRTVAAVAKYVYRILSLDTELLHVVVTAAGARIAGRRTRRARLSCRREVHHVPSLQRTTSVSTNV